MQPLLFFTQAKDKDEQPTDTVSVCPDRLLTSIHYNVSTMVPCLRTVHYVEATSVVLVYDCFIQFPVFGQNFMLYLGNSPELTYSQQGFRENKLFLVIFDALQLFKIHVSQIFLL